MKLLYLLLILFIVNVNCQFYDDDDDYMPPSCPDGGLIYYKNCSGDLDQCSRCLGVAEQNCEKNLGKSCGGSEWKL